MRGPPPCKAAEDREWSNGRFRSQELSNRRGYCLSRADHDHHDRRQFRGMVFLCTFSSASCRRGYNEPIAHHQG